MAKVDLFFIHPLMNAAGTLGFAPEAHGPVDLAFLGAFVTNPVSLGRRTPAHGKRFLPFPGGFLLHTGFPNPGLNTVIWRCAERWARSSKPVIVNLLANKLDEVAQMSRRLEVLDGVMGIELGLPKGADREAVVALTQAACGELPVIVRLPLEQAANLAQAAVEAGAAAVSLGAPRGVLLGPQGEMVQGRLYGPGIFPLALTAVQAIAQSGVLVIGAGGVYHQSQVEAMLKAGALAVQLDSVLWRGGGPHCMTFPLVRD